MVNDSSELIIEEESFPKEDWSYSVYATSEVDLTEPVLAFVKQKNPNKGQWYCSNVFVDIWASFEDLLA